MKKKLNRQGFTLIELLAALVILALLMAVAAPNVLGTLNRSKSATYVEDAKKLATRAEYVMRGNNSIKKPTGTGSACVTFSLGYLDNSEFDDPPNGGAYYSNRSFVTVCKEGGEYKYYVQLLECGKEKVNGTSCTSGATGHKGIKRVDSTTLYADNAVSKVVAGSGFGLARSESSSNKYCENGLNLCSSAEDNMVLEDAND